LPKTVSYKFGIPHVFGQTVPDSLASDTVISINCLIV